MLPCVPHHRMCTALGRISIDGDFNRRRGLYIKEVQPQDARSIKFLQDRQLPCPKHVGATATIFVAAQPTGISFKPGRKCRRRRGLGRSSKKLNRNNCPTNPPGGVIDHMRQGSIVRSVGPLRGPGRQRSHASAGQPDRPEGEDQLGPTTNHLGPCRRRTFQRTWRTNQKGSTSSLRRRRRHHRLLGIHCRRHSDRRAATLRGSGPVSGPVAGRA
jgi:hypothetical protein